MGEERQRGLLEQRVFISWTLQCMEVIFIRFLIWKWMNEINFFHENHCGVFVAESFGDVCLSSLKQLLLLRTESDFSCLSPQRLAALSEGFFLTQFGWSTAQNTTPADEVGLRGQVEATGSVDEVLKKFSHLVLLRRQPSFIRENKRDWSPDLCCCCCCDYCLEISVSLISD